MPEDQTETRIIEVFRPGRFTPMVGEAIDFTADLLRDIAAAYDPALSDAPSVVGHPQTDDPAYGWARRFFVDDRTGVLKAEIGDLDPAFADAVAAKRYKKVSMSFFRPDSPANPKPGTWYPRHIGFLGAKAPAVPGLKPVSFAGGDNDVVEFVASSTRSIGVVLRSLRDFLIEKFSLEEADKVLPDYELRWIDDLGREEEASGSDARPIFSEPHQELPMPHDNPAADPAAREAALARREAEIAEREKQALDRERRATHEANVAFAETLVTEGRVLPVQRDRLVATLDVIDAAPASVSFSDGAEAPAGSALKAILRELPPVVPLGMSEPGDAPGTDAASFAAPDNMTVDNDRLETHNRALAYQRQNPTVSYTDAVKAVETGI